MDKLKMFVSAFCREGEIYCENCRIHDTCSVLKATRLKNKDAIAYDNFICEISPTEEEERVLDLALYVDDKCKGLTNKDARKKHRAFIDGVLAAYAEMTGITPYIKDGVVYELITDAEMY